MNTTSGRSSAPAPRHERDGAHPETDTVISLGSWTRTLRTHHNHTRREAERLTGISRDYLKDIENGLPPSQKYLQNLIDGYRLDTAQTRTTWDLWRPPVHLPPATELRERIRTPARCDLLDRLDRSGFALAYLDPAWNILAANNTFFTALPNAGARTEHNFALWALPPTPQPSPVEPLLAHPDHEAHWLTGMLRGSIARHRASPHLNNLYQQLSHNTTFHHHWHTSPHVAHGRGLRQPLHLRNPATTLHLQITELTDAPEIRSFLAWPPPQPGPP